ncbi:MAG: hypothetical protein KME43_21365 [Myxacorys chilensis ATA2-1-KO14]|jgi:hypothetical protein|nr:hypothetical protein [Myxacorys chilensis ATA2-1-KO14]
MPQRKRINVSYADIAGELDLTIEPPLLRSQDLKTGNFNGSNYRFYRKGLNALPEKYRRAEKVNLYCRMRTKETVPEPVHYIEQIYHAAIVVEGDAIFSFKPS